MACGLPYTIAAQVAFPKRQCVAFVGDGGFSMLMAEFVTAVKYQLPVKIVVIKNNVLGQIKWEQLVFLGNPEYAVELAPIDFAMFARACGGEGITIEDPLACGAALDAAFGNGRPTIIQPVVDPLEAPLPAKVKPEQALRFAESLMRGQENAGAILKNALREKSRELI
jgi:pyruvate dehydrogenase (quinone)/pyruvate oxidase